MIGGLRDSSRHKRPCPWCASSPTAAMLAKGTIAPHRAPIAATPATADAIGYAGGTLSVPD